MPESFSAILRNPHFARLCVPIRVVYHSHQWKRTHADVPIRHLLERWEKFTFNYDHYPHEYIPALTRLLSAIAKATPRLAYQQEDLNGYQRLLEEHGGVVAHLFGAYASGSDRFITPGQAATLGDDAESTWRNRAAAGEIPGAWKAGKQWLLPVSVIEVLYGVVVPAEVRSGEPDADDVPEPEISEAEAQDMLARLERGEIDLMNGEG